MNTATAPELTLADVLRQLGGISPRRIRFRPAPGTATERDVVNIRDRERRLFEQVDGVLVEKVMGYWESVLAAELARLLGNFVKRRKLGTLAGEAGMLLLSPGLVRIPDLSFVSRARLARHRRARPPILPLAPDLAIEILSEGNTPREMARKVREFFAAGCRLVWLVDPRDRTVAV
jgi:Uma2 family endonuclease